MKILIFGGQGNLGAQLAKEFDIEENEVIAWDKGEIDVTDKQLVAKKIADIRPAIIINAVAYNAVDKCEADDEEQELARKLNADLPANLADCAIEQKAILVHYSTDYVFAGDNKEGYKETDETQPINYYGKTKQMGEKEVIKRSGSGLKWFLIRTSKLFGPAGPGEFSKPSFFDVMLKVGAERKQVDVVNEEESCFTYTPDLAKATKQLIDEDYGYGVYHIVNSRPATWHKAAQQLFKLAAMNTMANPVRSEAFPRPARRPKYSVLLNTKFPKLRDFKEALQDYLRSKK